MLDSITSSRFILTDIALGKEVHTTIVSIDIKESKSLVQLTTLSGS
jgi:hypothetical protein